MSPSGYYSVRLLTRSKLGCRPRAFGVQVREAVSRERQRESRLQRRREAAALESLHAAALESLLSGFQARRRTAPRWASAKRRHLQERRVAPKNRLERPVGRLGVTQRQASASRPSAAGDGATAKQQCTRQVEKVVPLESLVLLERVGPVDAFC